jgi:hypothetical protein
MMKKLAAITVGVILAAGSALAAFPTNATTQSLILDKLKPDFRDFRWEWRGYDSQKVTCTIYSTTGTGQTLTGYLASFQATRQIPGGEEVVYISKSTSQTTVSGSNITFTVAYTNVPPNGVYKAELFLQDATTAVVTRSLGRGTIKVEQSLYANDGSDFTYPSLSTTIADLSDVILTSTAWGDILYRGQSAWNNLAASTSGYVLTTAGASANPSWTAKTTDTTFTNYFAFTGPGTYTGTARSGSNTLTQILSDFTGIGLLANLVEDTTPQLGAQLDAQQYYIGGSTANKGMRVQDDGDVNFSVDNDFSIASVGSAGVLSLDMASMLVNDAFWMGLGSGAARIIYTNTTTDTITFSTANVRIGNGSPGVATAAESLYVEGNIETDGSFAMANGVTVTNILTTLTSNDVSLATGAAILKYGTANWASAGGSSFATNSGNFGTFHTNLMTMTWQGLSNALVNANAAGGGIIELSSGSITTHPAGWTIPGPNIWVRGKGYSTVIDGSGTTETGLGTFINNGSSNVWFSDFRVVHKLAQAGTRTIFYCNNAAGDYCKLMRLRLENADTYAVFWNNGQYLHMEDIVFVGAGSRSVYIGASAQYGYASGCESWTASSQQYSISGNWWTFIGCLAEDGVADGWVVGGSDNTFVGCNSIDNGSEGWYLSGARNKIHGGVTKDNTIGIFDAGTGNNVIGVSFGENGADAAIKCSGATGGSIVGITTLAGGTDRGIWLDNTDNKRVSDCWFSGEDVISVQVDSDCDGNSIGPNAPGTTVLNNAPTHADAQIDAHLKALAAVESQTDAAVTLSMSDCMGTLQVNGDDDVIDFTLPAAQKGLSVTFVNMLYAQVITVDCAAGDAFVLNDGSTNAYANAVDSSGAADDKGTFVAIDGTYWMIISEQNAWSDGGAD